MRITETMRFNSASLSQSRAADQLFRAMRQASSGLKAETPSDDPGSYGLAVTYDAAITRLTTRSTSVGLAADLMDLADGALAQAADLVGVAKDAALEMSNGEVDAATRANAASHVHALRDQLLGLANAKGPGGYIFGGTATGAPPFTQAGAFVGNDHAIHVEVFDGATVRTNPSGAKAFTAAGGSDVLAELTALEQALTSNDVKGIQAAMGELGQAQDQIISARVMAGANGAELRSAATMTASALTALQTARSNAVQADPVQAYTRLAQMKTTYEASIQVTAEILKISSIKR